MTEPFDDDAAAIRAALADAHVPSLLCAVAHLTGAAPDPDVFQTPVYDFFGDGQGGLAEDQQEAARILATNLLLRWRDAGYPPPARLPDAEIRAAMDYIAGVEIPAHYAPFLTEELALDGPEARAAQVSIDASGAAKAAFPVAIVGAGMSGLLAGIALKRAGLPFTIFESHARAGGTWHANQYPGARVDTPNHLYSYSFEPAADWPLRYSTQPLLQDYFERIVAKYDLAAHIRFETTVDAMAWDGAQWQVDVTGPAGPERVAARAVISAVGQLNRPKLPDIHGIGSFAGPAFHSARWDHDVDLTGKRVAVIGTGASAFQFVPEIAPQVAQLSVFQRTPPWLAPAPEYHSPVLPGKQWALRHMPFYQNWYRFWLFWMLTDGILPAVAREAGWSAEGSISTLNAELRAALELHAASQTAGRPDLYAKIVPAYAPGGKRMLLDNGVWVEALKRDNVALLTDAIAAIEPAGVRLADGRLVEADVLIYGTGFHASEFLMPMRVTGESGRDLHTAWGGDARAYLGMTMPGFPNLFALYGPNTNIVVNGSIVFFSECSVNYVMGCLKLLVEGGLTAMAVRPEIHDAHNVRVDAANAEMAWGQAGVSSWYKSASGRVAQNWPFALVDYWAATRAPAREEFEIA